MSDTTELELQPEPAPRQRSNGRMLAGLLAVVAVLAGGIFAITALSGDENKPEDPVRAMFEAAEKSDVIGVLEQLAPGERDALRKPLTELVDQLNRLEVLKDADARDVAGVEIEVKDLTLQAKEVSDDLAQVRITGGQGTFRSDLAKLPLGDFVLDLVGHPLEGRTSESDSLKSKTDDDAITTVKRGGQWYVSIGYSLAEAARRDANVSLDDMGAGVAPAGADSPEEAVRQLAEAAVGLDLRKVIALLPPDELGAVQDYAGMFLPQAEQGIADVEDDFSGRIKSLELDSDVKGDEAVVKVTKAEFEGKIGEASIAYEGGCLTFADPSSGEPKKICQGDDPLQSLNLFGSGMFGGLSSEDLQPPDVFDGKTPDVGIVVRKIDGTWYVDPTRTALDAVVSVLKQLDRADLDAIVDYVKRLGQSFTESFEAGFSEESSSAPLSSGY